MNKPADNNYPINHLLEQRWSPRAFREKMVEKEKILSILEAARWAPSAMNEQPWRFIVGVKGDGTWDKIFDALVEWNQQWAGKAPVLILNLAKRTYTYKGRPNNTYAYDTGQAVAMMVTEAVNQGLFAHQMGGFSAEKAAELFDIPDDFQPISVTAIGHYGNVEELPIDMQKSEIEERKRRSLNDTVFSSKFGEPYSDL